MALRIGKTSVREPAVAGFFYPRDPAVLRDDVTRLLTEASVDDEALTRDTKALIAPHAGYIYSGPVAAAAYKLLEPRRQQIRRVVLIGPSHRVYFRGIALPSSAAFATPLGEVPIDLELAAELMSRGDVLTSDAPHEMEHSLEVHLPFLQVVLGEFTLVPLVTGEASAALVANVLDTVWGDAGTLIVASSDLSHYLTYRQAQAVDAQTNALIVARRPELRPEQACGALPINALLTAANERDLLVAELLRLNSGDTSGNRNRVVGYGSYAIH
jgi:AmmeMemoRadiSam system protein B